MKPLIRGGYRFGKIYFAIDTFVLHVERIEKHTPQSLQARNSEFDRLSEEFALDLYDGWDVGPVGE
jgi:hypothetical protein